MEVYLPIAEVNINAIEILLLSAIVGVLSGLSGGVFFLLVFELVLLVLKPGFDDFRIYIYIYRRS